MKNLLIILSFISSVALAGNGSGFISDIRNYGFKIGSDTPTRIIPGGNIGKTISLVGGKTVVTAANYYRLVLMGSGTNGANYQVTSGKTLYCSGIWVYNSGSVLTFQIGYGTAAVTDDNASAPAGQVIFAANSTGRTLTTSAATTQGNYQFFPFPMSFPSQSFPYIQARDAVEFGVMFLCEEQ